jgi:hypothetical protein
MAVMTSGWVILGVLTGAGVQARQGPSELERTAVGDDHIAEARQSPAKLRVARLLRHRLEPPAQHGLQDRAAFADLIAEAAGAALGPPIAS